MNYKLHELFDSTDCIEEIVRPTDSNVFQDRSPLSGIQSLAINTPSGNRNLPFCRVTRHNYHHESHHHSIQHYRDTSPNSRERTISTQLADIQLTDRGYRGGDDDDDLMIGGGNSGGMIELRDLGGISSRNAVGTSQITAANPSGYENPRRDSKGSLTDLTRSSYAETRRVQEALEQSSTQLRALDETIIPAGTIRERVATASATRVAAARAVLASATSNLRRRGGNRSSDLHRSGLDESQPSNFSLQVDLHQNLTDIQSVPKPQSNNDDVLEQVFGRRCLEIDKVRSFLDDAHEIQTDKDPVNEAAIDMPDLRSGDVVVIVDESSPEHQSLSKSNLPNEKRSKSQRRKVSNSLPPKQWTDGKEYQTGENQKGRHYESAQGTGRNVCGQKDHSDEQHTTENSKTATENEHTSIISNSGSNYMIDERNSALSTFVTPSYGHSHHVTHKNENQTSSSSKNNPGIMSDDNHARRRFSNLSNLAQSLPSTSSSATALMRSRAGLGSVDLAAILSIGQNREIEGATKGSTSDSKSTATGFSPSVRRTQSVLVTCSSAAIVNTTPHILPRTRVNANKSTGRTKLGVSHRSKTQNSHTYEKSEGENLSEEREEREIVSGSRSPLLTRSISLEKIGDRQYLSGNVSFDPTAGDRFSRPFNALEDNSKRDCSIYGSDMDMETYQAELEEATNALLDARKYLIACDKSDAPSEIKYIGAQNGNFANDRKTLLSDPTNKSDIIEAQNRNNTSSNPLDNEKREQGANPGYLGVTGPLDWLFSDSEPEPGPSSPKLVQSTVKTDSTRNKHSIQVRRQRQNNDSCSSQGSSGTDTETRSLLKKGREPPNEGQEDAIKSERTVLSTKEEASGQSKDLKATGAIPKKRANPMQPSTEGATDDMERDITTQPKGSKETFQVRKTSLDDQTLQEDSSLPGTGSALVEPHQQRRSFKLLSRRRPPTPPTGTIKNVEVFQEAVKNHPLSYQPNDSSLAVTAEPTNGTTAELKQRILEILSSNSPEECQRELAKLKIELENRNRQMAAALSAAQLPSAATNQESIETCHAPKSEETEGHITHGENVSISMGQRRRKNHKTGQKQAFDGDNQTQLECDQHGNNLSNVDVEAGITHNERRRRRRAERRRIEREERTKLVKAGTEGDSSHAVGTTTTTSTIPSTPALVNLLAAGSVVDASGTHLATDHEDTTEGAIHCFQDEFGNWHSYTFGQESSGTARTVATASVPSTNAMSTIANSRNQDTSLQTAPAISAPVAMNSRTNSNASLDSFTSGLTVILDSPAMSFQPKRSSSINNSGALQGDDLEEGYSQSGGTIGSIAASSIASRSRYERRGSSSDRRADITPSYTGQRSTGVFSHQLSVIDRPFDRQQSNATNSTLGSTSGAYRSHRSPLHLFAESLLERTRLAASAATTAVGNTHAQVVLIKRFI